MNKRLLPVLFHALSSLCLLAGTAIRWSAKQPREKVQLLRPRWAVGDPAPVESPAVPETGNFSGCTCRNSVSSCWTLVMKKRTPLSYTPMMSMVNRGKRSTGDAKLAYRHWSRAQKSNKILWLLTRRRFPLNDFNSTISRARWNSIRCSGDASRKRVDFWSWWS